MLTANIATGTSTTAPVVKESRLVAQKVIVYNVIFDYVNVVLLLLFASYLRYHTQLRHFGLDFPHATLPPYPFYYPFSYFFIGGLLAILSFWYTGLYQIRNCLRFQAAIQPILRGVLYWILAVVIVAYFLKISSETSRLYLLVVPGVMGLGLLCWRYFVVEFWIPRLLKKSISQRVLFVGWTEEADKLFEAIQGDTAHLYEAIGCIPSAHQRFEVEPPYNLPVLGDYNSLRALLHQHQIEIVILADLNPNVGEIIGLANSCEKEMVQFSVIPSYFRILLSGLTLKTISGVPILGVAKLPLDSVFNRIMKRGLDVIGALVGLLFFGPAIVIFGFLVYRESPGPIIYRQRRVGRNGEHFYIYKIRSMRLDAEASGSGWTVANDPRRLHIGAFMRAWNIDELPQFWNVLKGDMSLVGPRPERPHLTQQFLEDIPHYNARHTIKPGITGWAQVHGSRGDTDIGIRVRYDLYYLENWSIWLDLQIMLMTFHNRQNAY